MRKKGKLIVFEEINGKFVPKNEKALHKNEPFNVVSDGFIANVVGFGALLVSPSIASAAGKTVDEVTGGIYSTLMNLFDTAVVFIIMFAGGAWALGHRNKAIHLLICVSCGYFLARNAVNIRDFMRSI